MTPSTFVKVWPLKLPEEEKREQPPSPAPGLSVPQYHDLSTPPSLPKFRGPEMISPKIEYPLPDHRVLTRKEERTISQRDTIIANAQDNMRFLGIHLVGEPVAGVVRSISSIMPKSGSSLKARLTSEVGTKSNWERNEALRWFNRRTQSDSGIDMQRNEVDRRTQHEMAMANDH